MVKGQSPLQARARGPIVSLRGAVTADKEDGPGGIVSDEEEEGVVRDKCLRNYFTIRHDAGSGSRSLSSLLVDLHESLVDDL